MANLSQRITEYLSAGGLFNPELANHDAVRDLIIDCRDEIERLRNPCPGDIESQAAAWSAVYLELVCSGLLSFVPNPVTSHARDRAVQFIRDLTSKAADNANNSATKTAQSQ